MCKATTHKFRITTSPIPSPIPSPMHSWAGIRPFCCRALTIWFLFQFLIDPIQGSSTSTLRHNNRQEERIQHEIYEQSYEQTYELSPPLLDLGSNQQEMNDVTSTISITTIHDSSNYDSSTTIDKLAWDRKLDGFMDSASIESSSISVESFTDTLSTTKKKKIKKQKNLNDDHESTPAPTPGYEPVDDLSIPEELNECLLEVLPENQDTMSRKRKKKKRFKHVDENIDNIHENDTDNMVIPTRRDLQESRNEFSLQKEQSHGFDYTSSNELSPFITSHNDVESYDYDTDILDFLYDDDEFADDNRRLQEDPENFDRDAINRCLKPWQTDAWVAIICVPTITTQDPVTVTEEPTLTPSTGSPTTGIPSGGTLSPTCNQPEIPLCPPNIICVPDEIVIPCEQDETLDDISCSNCPCQCPYTGKGKGKGKGVEIGKGKGEGYVGKGKGSEGYHPHYSGKGKGKGYGKGYGKGKGSKGGYSYYKYGVLDDTPIYDARVVRFVRVGICIATEAPSLAPTEFPSVEPSITPTRRPTPIPSIPFRTSDPTLNTVQPSTLRPAGTPPPTPPRTTPVPTSPTTGIPSSRTLSPTCNQPEIPLCPPNIICVPDEIVIPCEQDETLDDISCSNCPCQCPYTGKGKGKGKGVEIGKGKGVEIGKGNGYVGKGNNNYHHYHSGKGKGKGSKGSKARVKKKKRKKAASANPSFSPQDEGIGAELDFDEEELNDEFDAQAGLEEEKIHQDYGAQLVFDEEEISDMAVQSVETKTRHRKRRMKPTNGAQSIPDDEVAEAQINSDNLEGEEFFEDGQRRREKNTSTKVFSSTENIKDTLLLRYLQLAYDEEE